MPVYEKNKKEPLKFISGFSEVNGYALNKTLIPLGFVSVILELTLTKSPVECYAHGEPRFNLIDFIQDPLNEQVWIFIIILCNSCFSVSVDCL
jgi:hypothetical protein